MPSPVLPLFVYLLRRVLVDSFDKPLADDAIPDTDTLKRCRKLSSVHEIEHLVAHSLLQIAPEGMLSRTDGDELSAVVRKAKYHYARQQQLREDICSSLEAARIPFVLLKGETVAVFYPEPWMRTGVDIDVLIHECDLPRAREILTNTLRMTLSERAYHDVTFVKDGLSLELHFALAENMPQIDKVLQDVWLYAFPKHDESAECALSNEFFMFYYYAHAAYHFKNGGCGMKTVCDGYRLLKKLPYDENAVKELCRKAGIFPFAEAFTRMILSVFETGRLDALTKQMIGYILRGGSFGTTSQKAAATTSDGKKSTFLLKRLFIGKGVMEMRYPVLREKPYLLPYYYGVRLLSLTDKHKRESALNAVKNVSFSDTENVGAIRSLMEELALKE